MRQYLARRIGLGDTEESLLFIEQEFSTAPLSRNKFLSYLREALGRIGFADGSFSGHSFRTGEATSGAAGCVEGHVLQVLGRWKSSCFTRYIRTQPTTIKTAQEKMNSTLL